MRDVNSMLRVPHSGLPGKRSRAPGAFVAVLAVSIILCAAPRLFADKLYSQNKTANKLYKNGQYEEALKMYDDMAAASPQEPKIRMNRGSAQYQMGDFDKAEESYNGASGVKDKKALADLYYNLGNAQYMQGERMAAQGPQGSQGAREKYKAALDNYIKALDLRSSDKDAKWNLQLASAKIKEMENRQQNDKDNKSRQNKQDRNKQQKQDGNNKDKQNQDKKDQDKNQDQNKDQNKNKQDKGNQNDQGRNNQGQQKPEPSPQQQKQDAMKKEQARKLLETYSDDEHDLKKKPAGKGVMGQRQSDEDW